MFKNEIANCFSVVERQKLCFKGLFQVMELASITYSMYSFVLMIRVGRL